MGKKLVNEHFSSVFVNEINIHIDEIEQNQAIVKVRQCKSFNINFLFIELLN